MCLFSESHVLWLCGDPACDWNLLCIEAIDMQYSHLFDYRAFPGFTGPWKQKKGQTDKTKGVNKCKTQK